ncbi:uncharacterized protein LOC133310702 [Gastrolobium bilobum]|uniref:uncharacterized protein LOC133310702 n=1 Tax=Gastrolobium bilobum TaxID=150636 RepID=UPI002AAF884A|nr:uncharacterized protein LOC133310702 [Gastrolobium bilobum]
MEKQLERLEETILSLVEQFKEMLIQLCIRLNILVVKQTRQRGDHSTPVHILAGHNKAKIVKFLLEWQGPDTVGAKNMYGETPLHMAAKNGCREAAWLLLAHGAFVEARANNGMTPLHLAVWYSLRVEEISDR